MSTRHETIIAETDRFIVDVTFHPNRDPGIRWSVGMHLRRDGMCYRSTTMSRHDDEGEAVRFAERLADIAADLAAS